MAAYRKPEMRQRAREMRAEGRSYSHICKELGIGPNTAASWIKDIQLSPEQKAELNAHKNTRAANVVQSDMARRLREQYQEEGRKKSRSGDQLHLMGTMLYWAEGTKSERCLAMVNTDADMMGLFVRFARECLHVPVEKFRVTLIWHSGNDLSKEDVETYWLSALGLPPSCIIKHTIGIPCEGKQPGKHPYGMARVQVNSVVFAQHVWGAIQEYAGIDRPEWLDHRRTIPTSASDKW